MNHIYKTIWNARLGTWVATAETARARGKTGTVKAGVMLAGLIATTPALAAPPAAGALPTGGQVQAGTAAIATSGNQMTITQGSDKAAIDWQSFSVGSGAVVQFIQPGAGSVALNRVLGSDASQIWGSLRANGQVFLVNPNGVLFAPGAQVDAAGILASTRDISVGDFMAGRLVFQGSGAGTVVNGGQLRAADGGYVVLVGAQVINHGSIAAPRGDVRMAAADTVQLRLDGRSLVTFEIQRGTLDGLVANHGAIQADGGRIWLTADALDALAKAVVNNTGLIEARTVADRDGTIVLLSDMQYGETHVSGRLDASAPTGGRGGFIETSAAKVRIADGTVVTTASTTPGRSGTWLIDPTDFVVAASGGDISGSTLSSNLGSGNVEIMSTQGAGGVDGKVIVDDAVTWSANRLTLNALGDIEINADMTGTGSAQLTLKYGQGAVAAGNTSTYTIAAGKKVDLPDGQNLTIRQGSDGTDLNFTVISSLGVAGSSGVDLQGLGDPANRGGLWALGADIDASATATWNQVGSGDYLGFNPIGNGGPNGAFTGRFEGLGHTISDLTIARGPATNVGLFGVVGTDAVVSHVHLTGAAVTGHMDVGALVGRLDGTLRNVSAGGTVTAADNVYNQAGARIGGLVGNASLTATLQDAAAVGMTVDSPSWAADVGGVVGLNEGTARRLSADAQTTVNSNGTFIGGVVGRSNAALSGLQSQATVVGGGDSSSVGGAVGQLEYQAALADSSASGSVSGDQQVGGLVGDAAGEAHITNSSASGSVSGRVNVGGLVGKTTGDVVGSHATGDVTGTGFNAGGLIGNTSGAQVLQSWANGQVQGNEGVGGLIGFSTSNVSDSDTRLPNGASGVRVSGNLAVGGLIGIQGGGMVSDTSAVVDVSGTDTVGGLIGLQWENVSVGASHATGSVTGTNKVGGLVGEGQNITGSYATGAVSGGDHVGGLVGYEKMGGTISMSYASGNVTGTGTGAGGLVGWNEGTVKHISQMPQGQTVSGNIDVGGLVGLNQFEVQNSVANATVNGTENVGGAIGRSAEGLFGPSYVQGVRAGNDVTGTTNVGGLIGLASGVAVSDFGGTASEATGTVSGSNQVGGFAGRVSGGSTIDGALASSTVQGVANVGGFVGEVTDGATISNSQASGGTVVATDMFSSAGGFAGKVGASTLTGNSTSRTVQAQYWVGGFAGYVDGGVTLQDNSASGDVTAAGAAGGFIGRNGASFDGTTNTTTSNVTATGGSVGGYIGTHTNAATVSNVTVANTVISTSTSSSSDVGGVVGYQSDGIIENVQFSGTVTAATAGRVGGIAGKIQGNALLRNATFTGTVTAQDTVGGLAGNVTGQLVNSTMNGTVVGTGTIAGGAIGVLELRTSGTPVLPNAPQIQGITVNGSLQGVNKVGGVVGENETLFDPVLQQITLNRDVSATGWGVGGWVGSNLSAAVVRNVQATRNVSSSFSGSALVGGVVGNNRGTIEDSSNTGTVQATGNRVGGIAGENSGTVTRSYATGAVSGANDIGGLIGRNDDGTVSIAFATGAVSGTDAVGGLVGRMADGTVTDAYATGSATGTNFVGGLAGRITGQAALTRTYASGAVTGTGADVGGYAGASVAGAATQSFYNTTTSGLTRSVGQGTEVADGKTAAQMREAATYAAWGNNLATIGGAGRTWRLYEGLAQPLLMHWLAPLTATTSGSFTYRNDGTVRTDTVQASFNDVARPGRVFGTAGYNAGPADGVYSDVTGLYSDQFGWDISIAHTGTLTIFSTPPVTNSTAGQTPAVSVAVSVPNVPSGAALSGPLGDRSAAQSWTQQSARQAEGGGSTGTTGTTDGSGTRSVVSGNTREVLDQRRAFSIGDGGIRLPRDAQAGEKEAN